MSHWLRTIELLSNKRWKSKANIIKAQGSVGSSVNDYDNLSSQMFIYHEMYSHIVIISFFLISTQHFLGISGGVYMNLQDKTFFFFFWLLAQPKKYKISSVKNVIHIRRIKKICYMLFFIRTSKIQCVLYRHSTFNSEILIRYTRSISRLGKITVMRKYWQVVQTC